MTFRGLFLIDKEGNVLWEQILGEGASHQPHLPAPALSALVQPEEIVTSDDRDSVEPRNTQTD